MRNPLRGGHGIDLETLARRVAPTISAPRHEPTAPSGPDKPEVKPAPTAAAEPPLVSTPPMPMGEFSLNFDSLEPPRFEDPAPERPAAKPEVRQEAVAEPVRAEPQRDPVVLPEPEPAPIPEPEPEPVPNPDPEPDRDPEPAPYWSPPLVRSSSQSELPPVVVEPKEKKATVYPSPNPTPYDHDQPGASRIPPDQRDHRRPEFRPQDLPQRPEGRKVSDLDRVFAMLQQALNASTAVDQTAHSLKARLYGENGEFHGPDEQYDHGPMIPRLLAIAEILRDQSLRAHAHLIDISRVA